MQHVLGIQEVLLGTQEVERNTQHFFKKYTEICKEVFQLGVLTLVQQELVRRIAPLHNRGIKSQKCTFDRFPNPSTFQCLKTSLLLWIKEVELTILGHSNRMEGVDSRILRCLMGRLRLL